MKNIIKLSAVLAALTAAGLQASCPQGLIKTPRGCQPAIRPATLTCLNGYTLINGKCVIQGPTY